MDAYRELIDSIRESRRRMSEECNHDPARYLAYLQSFNARYSKQIEKATRQPNLRGNIELCRL